ncbi:MAG: hypothetical protein LW832_06480 [Parachlamydia sp.]|nr:hypothetical protein [Parachlamydia sp.]
MSVISKVIVKINRVKIPKQIIPVSSIRKKNLRKATTDREEIAFRDRDDNSLYNRNINRGNWDYKENWRYDKDAFYAGVPESEAYDIENPGMRGYGYDGADAGGYPRQYYYGTGYSADPYINQWGNASQYQSSYNVSGNFRPVPNSSGYYNTYPSMERIEVPSNPSNNANFDNRNMQRRR